MLRAFAVAQGNNSFRPVFIDYRNMERVLNVQSLGNLNRQFVSLLRSEQDTADPIVGEPFFWESIIDSPLLRLNDALGTWNRELTGRKRRRFPYLSTMKWVWRNPKVVPPGLSLSWEIAHSFFSRRAPSNIKLEKSS
jgi:hypothetical protein